MRVELLWTSQKILTGESLIFKSIQLKLYNFEYNVEKEWTVHQLSYCKLNTNDWMDYEIAFSLFNSMQVELP